MYTEKDLLDIAAQQKKRWLVLGLVCLALLCGIVYSVVIRLEVLTTSLTIILGVVFIADYELGIRPLRCYQTHVDNALHGRTRQLDGVFRTLSEDVSVVDGVKYHAMTIEQEEQEDTEACERLFYFDMEKPFPDLKDGDRVHVIYHDREVAALSRI